MNKTIDKERQAIRFLNSIATKGHYELAYSGGKDSDVLLYLANLSSISFTPVYKCTTIDPPFTISHCRNAGAEILRPAIPFFKMMEKKGAPTMWRRWCCDIYKEYYHAPLVLTGIRREESVRRAKRYQEPETCRNYGKNKRTIQYMPMLDFTLDDVRTIIVENHLKLHPLYYDENGVLDVTRRLGCIGCPLRSDRGKADFLRYPRFFLRWVISFLRYYAEHKYTRNPYLFIVELLFYSNNNRYKFFQTYEGLFEAPDPRRFLEEYFHVQLPPYENFLK